MRGFTMLRYFFRMAIAFMLVAGIFGGSASELRQTTDGLQTLSVEEETVLQAKLSSTYMRVIYFSKIKPNYVKPSLYSVGIDGTDRIELTPGVMEIPISERAFMLTPDQHHVVYIARYPTDNVFQLYTVPITGGSPRLITQNMPTNSQIRHFKISPDGSRIDFHASINSEPYRHNLYSVNIDGSSQILHLNYESYIWDGYKNEYSDDGNILSAQIQDGRNFKLYRINFTTGEKLLIDQIDNSESAFVTNVNQDNLVYSRPISDINHPIGIYLLPITTITPTLISTKNPLLFLKFANDSVVFFSDSDLYAVRLSDGMLTNLTNDSNQGGLIFEVTPDAKRIIYLRGDLWSVTMQADPPVQLTSITNVSQKFFISPDSSRVIFKDLVIHNTLYSAPVDGSSVPVQINSEAYGEVDSGSIAITADSAKVLYRARNADINDRNHATLLATSINGDTEPLRLSGLIPWVAGFQDQGLDLPYLLSSDGSLIVFRGGLIPNCDRRLYSNRVSLATNRIYAPVITN
jgi:hypothetical protein